MKDLIDVHTHTLASGHAYSTIREMTVAAKKKNLALLGITEHAPMMPGSCQKIYFSNLNVLERDSYEVPVRFGVELNILNRLGEVDLPEKLLDEMDYCIASLHPPCYEKEDIPDATDGILGAIRNPYVQIIGHPDDGRFPLNYDEIAAAAAEHDVLLEINNASLSPNSFRPNAKENYMELLSYCAKYRTRVIMGSDAHVDTHVGAHDRAIELLNEIKFPQELVINGSVSEFLSLIGEI